MNSIVSLLSTTMDAHSIVRHAVTNYVAVQSGKPGLAFPAPKQYLETAEIKETLRRLPIKNLYFMGGEPTLARNLTGLLRFAKEELGLTTKLGHTNGSGLPLPYLDGANVGLKAWDADIHRAITGQDRDHILTKVAFAHAKGMNSKD